MSILAALVRAYDRLPDAPRTGFSSQKISVIVSLNSDGSVASVTDCREIQGKKRLPRVIQVPQSKQAMKRANGIAPNFLWDKTQYVLGVAADPKALPEAASEGAREAWNKEREKNAKRALECHAEF